MSDRRTSFLHRIRKVTIPLPLVIIIALFSTALGVYAATGTTDSPAAPEVTNSHTLEDIWNRLNDGTAGSQSTFTEPSVAPGTGTMHTLDQIMGLAPTLDAANGATATDVLTGKTFWGLTSGEWALQTGSITTRDNVSGATGDKTFDIPDGYYSGKTATANDPNLKAGNIYRGIPIFGVTGTLNPSGIPKTGQTAEYAFQDDGSMEMGVSWPNPRFTDNGDGTVTDHLTDLIWLKNARCVDVPMNGGVIPPYFWAQAITWASKVEDPYCGLTDGSNAFDWRLPNVRELQSLVDYSRVNPALPTGHPFINVQTYLAYWSSTTNGNLSTWAWAVKFDEGFVTTGEKLNVVFPTRAYFWAVRGGQ